MLKYLLFLYSFLSHCQLNAQSLKVMTFNIRLNTESDKENRWDLRKENAASILRFYDVDVCGMQEAFIGQIKDVANQLPKYAFVGKGRDDGKEAGEFSPIFYNQESLILLDNQTFWLSQTPEMPSKGWDASFHRVVTWAKFKHKQTKKVFYVFNTHFDHKGEVARQESAKLLIAKVKQIAKDKEAIIIGDFNSSPLQTPYLLLNEAFVNTKLVSTTPHFGPQSTFNGFEAKEIEGMEIDHIFTNNIKMIVAKHATLSPTWGGRFASDHHAVLVEVVW
jgi:endonuclease/exonuclease/phosphatase family metal-dependent hydrolase